jgi:predicted lipoprotein with Yx(FWY)xxD motif
MACLVLLASLVWAAPTQGTQAQTTATVTLQPNATLGPVLAGNNGLTLYRFLNDKANESTCLGGCATVWPPLLVDAGVEPTAGEGVTGTLGTITRPDGKRQVTYNGIPLYFFAGNANAAGDAKPGDTNGQGIGGVWFILKSATQIIGGEPVEVAFRHTETLGRILTANKGFSLYQFLNDKGSESVCYDGCAKVWPPLLIGKDLAPSAGRGIHDGLGTTIRRDGNRQVTFQGIPLYFFAGNPNTPGDATPGDTNGQGIGGVWFVYQARVAAVLFTSVLNGAAEVNNEGVPNQGDPDGVGVSNVRVIPNGDRICINTIIANVAPLVLAHIHNAPAGKNGPVVVDFTHLINGNTVRGCVHADEQLLRRIALAPQNYYVNIHSEEFRPGAVRGQLK